MKIGDRIRNLRRIKRMTQGELVRGIASITYLSKVENHQTLPAERFVRKIAERLQVDPALFLEEAPAGFVSRLEAIYERFWRYDAISEEDLALLQVQVNEPHDNRSLLMMFAILIRQPYIRFRLQDAKARFEQSVRFIQSYDSSAEESLYFRYYLICGKLLADLHMLPQANEYLMRCETYLPSADDQERAKYYFTLSIVKQQLHEDKYVSLYYSGQSLAYQRKVDDPRRLAMVLFARAIQFQLVGQPKDAMDSLSEAKACCRDPENRNLRAVFAYSTGRVYQVGNDFAQAVSYYETALELYAGGAFEEKSIQVHQRLVEIYIEQKDWRRVEEHLGQARALARRNPESYYELELDILQAGVYKLQARESPYEKTMKKLLAQCRDRQLLYHFKSLAAELGAYFYDKGAYKKAASYYHQAASVR